MRRSKRLAAVVAAREALASTPIRERRVSLSDGPPGKQRVPHTIAAPILIVATVLAYASLGR